MGSTATQRDSTAQSTVQVTALNAWWVCNLSCAVHKHDSLSRFGIASVFVYWICRFVVSTSGITATSACRCRAVTTVAAVAALCLAALRVMRGNWPVIFQGTNLMPVPASKPPLNRLLVLLLTLLPAGLQPHPFFLHGLSITPRTQ
jgi:hypothetical protein